MENMIGYCGYNCHLCFDSMPNLLALLADAGKLPAWVTE